MINITEFLVKQHTSKLNEYMIIINFCFTEINKILSKSTVNSLSQQMIINNTYDKQNFYVANVISRDNFIKYFHNLDKYALDSIDIKFTDKTNKPTVMYKIQYNGNLDELVKYCRKSKNIIYINDKYNLIFNDCEYNRLTSSDIYK